MQINAYQPSISNIPNGISETVGKSTAPTREMPFASIMSQFIQEIDQQQQIVTQGANDLAAGKSDNIHEIAINVAQADIAFRFAMEVRDKLIAAYQEVMRMQI